MTRRPRRLIDDPPPGLRERVRADGSVRVWWEPPAEARARGVKPVELDAGRLTWSVRKAAELNRQAARGPRAPVVGQTIGHLIDDYGQSLRFRRLKPVTQVKYRDNFRLIRAKWGPRLVADFDKPAMNTWYEALHRARGAWMALGLMRAMSLLFAHAELRGWRPEGSNPCQRLKLEIPKGRRRTADWAELDALLAAADAAGLVQVGHAILLSLLQGQRQTDVLGARASQFHQLALPAEREGEPAATIWVWLFERSKRGNDAFAVLHDETVARIGADLLGRTDDGPLLVDDRTGQPWSPRLFGARFAEVRAAAIKAGCRALKGLQYRDLRRTFGALGRRGGASKSDVADVLGNSAAVNQHLGDIYMAPQIITALRVARAIQRPASGPDRKSA